MKSLNLLFVDDEAGICIAAEVLLRRRVGTYRDAGDGESALALLRQERADVVVTDLRMPQSDGVALAQAIRAMDAHDGRRTKVVVTTAYRPDDVPALEGTALFDAVLAKPISPPELFALLEKYAEGGDA